MRKGLFILFVLLLPCMTFAQQGADITEMPPIMNRLLLRDGRFEVTPSLGVTLNDEYTRSVLLGVSGAYHFKEWLGAGLELIYGQPVKTWLSEKIEGQTGGGFTVSRSYINVLVVPYIQLTPFSGKFLTLGKYLGYADVHFDLGAGMSYVGATGALDPKTTWTVMFGGGMRFFILKSLTVNLSFHDYLVDRTLCIPNASNVTVSSEITHNLALSIGVGFFFPRKPHRQYK